MNINPSGQEISHQAAVNTTPTSQLAPIQGQNHVYVHPGQPPFYPGTNNLNGMFWMGPTGNGQYPPPQMIQGLETVPGSQPVMVQNPVIHPPGAETGYAASNSGQQMPRMHDDSAESQYPRGAGAGRDVSMTDAHLPHHGAAKLAPEYALQMTKKQTCTMRARDANERKKRHASRERQRQAEVSQQFELLRVLLPSSNQLDHTKIPKVALLKMTRQHLIDLTNKNEALMQEANSLRNCAIVAYEELIELRRRFGITQPIQPHLPHHPRSTAEISYLVAQAVPSGINQPKVDFTAFEVNPHQKQNVMKEPIGTGTVSQSQSQYASTSMDEVPIPTTMSSVPLVSWPQVGVAAGRKRGREIGDQQQQSQSQPHSQDMLDILATAASVDVPATATVTETEKEQTTPVIMEICQSSSESHSHEHEREHQHEHCHSTSTSASTSAGGDTDTREQVHVQVRSSEVTGDNYSSSVVVGGGVDTPLPPPVTTSINARDTDVLGKQNTVKSGHKCRCLHKGGCRDRRSGNNIKNQEQRHSENTANAHVHAHEHMDTSERQVPRDAEAVQP